MRLRPFVAALALAASPVGGSASEEPVFVPSGEAPAVVHHLGPLEGLLAFAISPDGASAAAASSLPDETDRSALRLVTPAGSDPETIELPGVARALLFSEDGHILYAILHKPRKKSAGEAFLFWVETDTLRASRAVRLPPSAAGLALWSEDGSLLVAATDEIRTFALPALTSGPLFRLPGTNLSLAPLGGADLLVGRGDGLALVNLDDVQGRDGLSPRERVETAEPVAGLAAAPEGRGALARLEGGSVHRVRLRPLRVEDEGRSALAVAWLGRPSPSALEARRASREREKEREAETPPEPIPVQVAERTPDLEEGSIVPEQVEPVAKADESAPAAEPTEKDVPPSAPVAEPVVPVPAEEGPERPPSTEPIAPAPALPAGLGAVRGRVTGPEASRVAAVVLVGPDDLLRTARRVKLSTEGGWSAEGLEPGLYRVLLAAEEGRVVVATPSYRTARVEAGRVADVPEIRADQVY